MMSSDAIAQLLLQVLLGATALFLLRLFWVREHVRYPLYVLSIMLAIVFAVPAIIPQVSTMSLAAADTVSFAMDLLLTPFVALELFRPAPAGEQRTVRHMLPAAAALLAGASVALYLSTPPDLESFKETFSIFLLMDTVMSMVVVGFLARKFREGTPAGDSNTMWLRRFFFLLTVMDLIATILGDLVEGPASKAMHLIYLSATLIATVGCLALLRKPRPESATVA